MKANRRDFIRKAALGSVAISSGGSLPGLSTMNNPGSMDTNEKKVFVSSGVHPASAGWEITFNEATSNLSLVNGLITVHGQLSFISGTSKWTVARSRDGVQDRYAIVDVQGNVQGYVVFQQHSDLLQIFFYHRTAQAYQGVLSFKGKIQFPADGFVCRTRAKANERVFSLRYGLADSLLNDSIFAPETDTALQLDAANLTITTANPDSFEIAMSGQINESAESIFRITLEEDYLRKRYVPYYRPLNRTRCSKAPTGWMSWNTYFDKATAADNLAEAKTGKKYLQPFGCEFWSIESWQGNSDQLPVRDFHNMNLEVNKKQFPGGMKNLADNIRKLGFRPGLWTAPFGTGNKKFYDAHKDWFLHDKEGKPVSSWNGRYTLDPTVPEAREHLKKIHKTASREWGYEFFKIDGMSGRSHGYSAHLYERPEIRASFRDPSCPNPFELVIKALREGIGDDRVFLACQGHSSGPEALYADASRIGADIVHPNKPVQWSNIVNQGRCTINQTFTHNIVMINDPDTLLVHDLPLEEARVTTTIVALPGQLTFFGDRLAGLSSDRMKMLQQTLPVADVLPMSLYPYFSMLPVWNLHVHHKIIGDYNVVALFNWEDNTETIAFTTSELGIDSKTEYTMYEFWTENSYGTIKESYSLEVPPHSVRLFTMHPVKTIPQWISSDRHVTQTALELVDYEWLAESRVLKGKISLIASFPLTMRLRIPEGFYFSTAKCEGAQCEAKEEADNILALTFLAEKNGDFIFRIQY